MTELRGPGLVFKQYYLECLSQASYLIGDSVTGRAAIVDPRRDVQEYLDDADDAGLAITHVFETHFHADFLSGHLELAERTGATIVFGAQADGRVEFDAHFAADGETVAFGDVTVEVAVTPGHTPESVCLIVRERPGAEPWGVLTGDTLFIGDVGRPDLLSAAGASADELARQLHRSLHERLLTLPDATRVFPAHGAGSACGKHISSATESTIGEQRATNYALAPMTPEAFVAAVTGGQAAPPMYFSFAANHNRMQRDTLDEHDPSTPLTMAEVHQHISGGGVVVDTRDANAFAAGHLAGAINVGLAGRFAEYVGEVVPAGTPIALVADDGTEHEAKVRLARIGFDDVIGHLAEPITAMRQNPQSVQRSSRLTAATLAELIDESDVTVIDVRGPGEVADGTIPGAINIPLASLIERLDDLQPGAPTVVYCAGGYRSSIAASTLRSCGFGDVSDLLGGISAWTTTGRRLTLPAEVAP